MSSPGLKVCDLAQVNGAATLSGHLRGAVLLLGNFDGMHRGHRALLAAGRELAQGAALAIMSADPHPRAFFDPELPPMRLSCGVIRRSLFAEAGFDYVFSPAFDSAFAGQDPGAFIGDYLVRRLGVAGVICGEDFRFGRRRAGDVSLLQREGLRHGFQVVPVPEVRDAGQRISSSYIRALLARGDITGAAHLLGAPWQTPVRACGIDCFRFEAEQMLPPAGRYHVMALDRDGRRLAEAQITLDHARQARAGLPRNTVCLAWG